MPRDLPRLATIPFGMPFAETLADVILDRHGGPARPDPLALADILILLPTRRACLTVREAFLRRGDGAPMLLPRLVPVGDLDAEALELSATGNGRDETRVPQAISEPARLLWLARLIAARPDFTGGLDAAARLARELAALLDEIETERADVSALPGLVPPDLAAHWAISVDFLSILWQSWPEILRAHGAVDPAERRHLLIQAQCRRWQAEPPATPVFAAGTTGMIPAVSDLLATVARLPDGHVILPGLDTAMADDMWAALEPHHPQYGLKRLVERLDTDRRAIPTLPGHGLPVPATDRARLIRETFRPAGQTDRWRHLSPPLPDACLAGLTCETFGTVAEEAYGISLWLREVLETPGRTAALITPDRRLARRVAANLRRWQIRIDDSAGRPLETTPVGAYLRLVARIGCLPADAAGLLALLKHPLTACGQARSAFARRVRHLDRRALRRPLDRLPLAELGDWLADLPEDEFTEPERTELGELIGRIVTAADPLTRLIESAGATGVPLTDLIAAHVAAAEALAATDRAAGPSRLWAREDGETAAAILHEFAAGAVGVGDADPAHYPRLFDAVAGHVRVRPAPGGHPRLRLLGLLEARLQRFDRVILGGLSEGTWPAPVECGAFLSRRMRVAFGLPDPDTRIGMTAHDFTAALAADEVILTRSARIDGSPTVESRWLSRLNTVIEASGLEPIERPPGQPTWRMDLDAPDRLRPAPPPEPRPAAGLRPRELSATAIERWVRNPYGIFASRILRLRKLRPLGGAIDAGLRGTIVHEVVAGFNERTAAAFPADAQALFLEIGREAFDRHRIPAHQTALWWPRLVEMSAWFVAAEAEQRRRAVQSGIEIKGAHVFDFPAGPFKLTARADRIDRLADGGLVIIDYKTGAPPSAADIHDFVKPQLPLEAIIAQESGFPPLPAAEVRELSHWQLAMAKRAECGRRSLTDGQAAEAIAATRERLKTWIEAFDDPAMPYRCRPNPDRAPMLAHDDFAHLARVPEWSDEELGEPR